MEHNIMWCNNEIKWLIKYLANRKVTDCINKYSNKISYIRNCSFHS
jgi:hypothetical protein